MLDLIAGYNRIIKSFHVYQYEQEGDNFRLKAQLTFTDKFEALHKRICI